VTDSKLRELERRWKETGSVEDEARYLLERVRVGDLEREKLELAAYCGHEGAQSAVVHSPSPARSVDDWVSGLRRWGHHAFAQVAHVAAEAVLPVWEDGERSFDDDGTEDNRPRAALAAVSEWLNCPCDDHWGQLKAVRDAVHDAWAESDHILPASSACLAALAAAEVVLAHDLDDVTWWAQRSLQSATDALVESGTHIEEAPEPGTTGQGGVPLHAALRRAVVPSLACRV